MKSPARSIALVCALLAATASQAQAPAASAPGMRMGGLPGMRMGANNTPGWAMMTPAERQAHHEKMSGMTDHAQCTAYMAQHHASMVTRASELGRAMPAKPRQDACAPLKK